ncbi:MAG TPA: DedA family protein/thiosulfate sulfurtransferase GlpE [Methylophilaceae bacterium]|nr:DedA family protein/thiosulfate sulfurtransferase GlpE [Methylophilaceae bacterium]
MEQFISLVQQFGLLIIFANVALEQGGLPIPAYPMLMVTGALLHQSAFTFGGLLATAVIAALIADLCWYYAGRGYGRRVLGKLCRISLSPDSCVKQTESLYLRFGPPALLFCKFVPGFASISSALAGSTGTRLVQFIIFDGLGAAIWAGSAIGLGMLFSDTIDELLQTLAEMGRWGGLFVLIALAVFIAHKWWERHRFLQEFRMSRISVNELYDLLESGQRPVIIDTRPSHLVESGWIPGALFVSLDKSDELKDQEFDGPVILYCSCPNEVTAAQVAKMLMRQGNVDVRPLQGGIDAWIEAGYPIEKHRQ